jgi:hypothetical protein
MKNKTKLPFLVSVMMILIFAINTTQAQFVSYGLKGGLNIANIGGSDAGDAGPSNGFHVGGFLGLSLLGIVAAEGGVYFSQKGYMVSGDNISDLQVSLNYIDIPVVVKFSPLPLVHFFAGPQVSYFLSGKSEQDGAESDIDNLRQLDMAIVAGVGMNLPMGLRLSAGYDYGFTTLLEENPRDMYNRVIKLTVGYKF